MKSIEEKARAYDEAIERARKLHENSNGMILKKWLWNIFPELKESEDERIVKELLTFFRESIHGGHILTNKEYDSWIAWLEKQGKKPDTNCLLSWSEMDEKMLQSLEGIVKDYWAKAEQEKNEIKIREASNVSYFLKTIQKSPLCWIKCSDGLPNKDGIYLVVTDGRHNDVYDMARYDSIEGWHKASEIIYWMPIPQLNNKSIIEQKSAGNIESSVQNKPWSEEDEKMLVEIVNDLQVCKSRDISRAAKDAYQKEIDWLKSLKDRVQPQPKQEWSEEEIEKAAQEWDSKANFNPFYMIMDGDKPTDVKQDITTHKESFKAGVNWILKSLRPQNR